MTTETSAGAAVIEEEETVVVPLSGKRIPVKTFRLRLPPPEPTPYAMTRHDFDRLREQLPRPSYGPEE